MLAHHLPLPFPIMDLLDHSLDIVVRPDRTCFTIVEPNLGHNLYLFHQTKRVASREEKINAAHFLVQESAPSVNRPGSQSLPQG